MSDFSCCVSFVHIFGMCPPTPSGPSNDFSVYVAEVEHAFSDPVVLLLVNEPRGSLIAIASSNPCWVTEYSAFLHVEDLEECSEQKLSFSIAKKKFQVGQVQRLKAYVTTIFFSENIFLFSGEELLIEMSHCF